MKRVRLFHPAIFVPALLLGAGILGCARTEPAAVEKKTAAPPAQPAPAESEVQFEPAYPTEVSAEGLTEKDVTQQKTPHAEEEKDHGHPH
jgi:hypothetical protein